jgi:phage gpG-like protein
MDASKTDLGIVAEADKDFKREARTRVRNAAKILQQAVRRKYSQGRGESRPGEPPGRQTGELMRSVRRRQRSRRDNVSAIVGSVAVFAKRLEFGGRDSRGIYIAPRPAWRPAVAENLQRMGRALEGK